MKNGFILMLLALFLGFGTLQAQSTTCAPKDCKKISDIKKCSIADAKKMCKPKSTAAVDLSLENILSSQQTETAKAVNVKNTTPAKKASCAATCQKAKKTSASKVALKQ